MLPAGSAAELASCLACWSSPLEMFRGWQLRELLAGRASRRLGTRFENWTCLVRQTLVWAMSAPSILSYWSTSCGTATPPVPDSRFVAGFGRSEGHLRVLPQSYRPHRILIERLVLQAVGDQNSRSAAAAGVAAASVFVFVAGAASKSQTYRSSLNRWRLTGTQLALE